MALRDGTIYGAVIGGGLRRLTAAIVVASWFRANRMIPMRGMEAGAWQIGDNAGSLNRGEGPCGEGIEMSGCERLHWPFFESVFPEMALDFVDQQLHPKRAESVSKLNIEEHFFSIVRVVQKVGHGGG